MKNKTIKYASNGEILYIAELATGEILEDIDTIIVERDLQVDPEINYISNNEIKFRIKKPSKYHIWSNECWIEDLSKLIEEKRNERNMLLYQCDWTQVADIPSSIKEVYAIYRKQLRDLDFSEANIKNLVFPSKPIIG